MVPELELRVLVLLELVDTDHLGSTDHTETKDQTLSSLTKVDHRQVHRRLLQLHLLVVLEQADYMVQDHLEPMDSDVAPMEVSSLSTKKDLNQALRAPLVHQAQPEVTMDLIMVLDLYLED